MINLSVSIYINFVVSFIGHRAISTFFILDESIHIKWYSYSNQRLQIWKILNNKKSLYQKNENYLYYIQQQLNNKIADKNTEIKIHVF